MENFHEQGPFFWVAGSLAFVVLVGLIGGACVRGPEEGYLVGCIRFGCILYSKVLHRLKSHSIADRALPESGAAVVVANHRSGADPLMIAITVKRRIRYMMAREYYETRGMRWLFRAFGCIPVNRDGNDLSATKAALKALKNGEVIGIFPQGGIRGPEEALEGKAGAALIAMRAGAPVVPVYVAGTPNLDSVFLALLCPSRSSVTWGTPIRLDVKSPGKPTREEIDNATNRIFAEIEALKGLPRLETIGEPGASKPV